MIVSPRYIRLAKGVAAGAIGMAVPFDKIVLAVMLGVQLRKIWMQELQHEEEVRAGGGGDSGAGGDSTGRLRPQAPLAKFIDELPEEYYGPAASPTK